MIPPKRFDIFPPDWRMLRRSRRVLILYEVRRKTWTCRGSQNSSQNKLSDKSHIVDGNFMTTHIMVNNRGILSTNFAFAPEILEIFNDVGCRSLTPEGVIFSDPK